MVSVIASAIIISQGLFAVPTNAAGTAYYVDGANLGGICNDTNSGTATGQAWCTVQKAATVATAGDVVHIRGGTYRETVTPANDGTSGNPVTYRPFQNEQPVIDGSDTVSGWSSIGNEETGGLFANGFESGDLTGYASTQADASNTVIVQNGSVNHGGFAMRSTYAGTDPDARANRNFTASDDVYARMYFRINSSFDLSASAANHTIMALRTSTTTTRASVHLLKSAGGQFYLNARLDSPSVTNIYTGAAGEVVPDTWYAVELRYKGNDAVTGGGQLWVDGALKGTVNNANTGGIQTSRLEVGGNSTGGGGAAMPTSGSSMYVDDVKVGTSALGAFSAPGNANVYQATGISWTARQLFENSTALGESQASLAAVNGPGKWHMDTGTSSLYVWTSDGTSPAGKTMEASRRASVFDLSGRSHISLDSLTLRRNNNNGSGAAVLGSASDNLSITDSTIVDNYGTGVYLKDTTGSTVAGNDLLRNRRLFGGGIRFENGSDNNLVADNTITGDGTAGGNGIFFCGDSTCNSTGNDANTVRGNVISNVEDSCLYFDSDNDSNLIERNICHGSVRDADDLAKGGNGLHLALGSDDNVIRNNIVYDMERHGISVRDGNASQGYISNNDTVIYHNTVYDIGSAGTGNGIDIQGGNANTTIRNNIVHGGSTASLNVDAGSTATTTSDYNLLYNPGGKVGKWSGTTYGALSDFRSASGQETHSLAADPAHRDASGADFRLLPASPAINGGIGVGIGQDIAGNAVPQGTLPDIGAYEFIAADAASSLTQLASDGTTVLTTASSTTATSLKFEFTMSSDNATDLLTPQIEIRPIGTAFSDSATMSGSQIAFSGTGTIGTVTVSGLASGMAYHWQARVSNPAGSSPWTSYGGNAENTPDISIAAVAQTPPHSPTPPPSPVTTAPAAIPTPQAVIAPDNTTPDAVVTTKDAPATVTPSPAPIPSPSSGPSTRAADSDTTSADTGSGKTGTLLAISGSLVIIATAVTLTVRRHRP